MPSAAPTFLRGGHALMTVQPANRSKYLKNRFNVFAPLKNGESTTKIMAIDDYDYEPNVALCLSEGCFMKFTIKKVDSNNFSLSWNYTGSPLMIGSMSIESITVVEG